MQQLASHTVRRFDLSIYYSPLRYPGGKNCIFPFVSRVFYENRLLGVSYAEPYAGGAGLALRLLFEGYVERIYINDLDKQIFAIWDTIINYTDKFCEWIKEVEISIHNWNKYRDILVTSDKVSNFELAKSAFFLNRTNISGIIKGGVIGGQNQKGKYKIDARFNKFDLINRIKKIETLKDRITISNLDGINFINKLNQKKESMFIYLDPPYYQKGADLYMNFCSNEDHRRLSERVRKLRHYWMVSYDNHEFILNLYSDQKKISYNLSQSASNRVGKEILMFSKELHFSDSISSLNSPKPI